MFNRRRFVSTVAASAAAVLPLAKLGSAQAADRVPQPERGRFYVVGHGQSIQDAIDRAVADGCDVDQRSVVLVKPGTYTENLAIYAGVDLDLDRIELRNCQPIALERHGSLAMNCCRLRRNEIHTDPYHHVFHDHPQITMRM